MLPDITELYARHAERWADDNIRGDDFRCPRCGVWSPLAEAMPASPNPWAPPICRGCAQLEEGRRA